MRRRASATLVLSLVLAFAACTDTTPNGTPPDPVAPPSPSAQIRTASPTNLGDPIPGLTPSELARFQAGDAEFDRDFTESEGLGPLFNNVSCSGCHEDGANGGPTAEFETHVANYMAGRCDELGTHGGPVIQDHTTPLLQAYSGLSSEPVPSQALSIAHRTTPMVFGFGLFEAIPDWEILALADPNDRNHDGVSGRPNILSDGRLGRFGSKATDATLQDFNAGAFQNEMGITSPVDLTEPALEGWPFSNLVDPLPEPELSAHDLAAATDYTELLAPPSRGPITRESLVGGVVFISVGCATCHVPLMVTGRSPIAALNARPVTPFTDFLLHDMGPGLADICRGNVKPSEFRTQPLLGLHFRSRYLYDGRASKLDQAITLHGGEGTRARDAYTRLTAAQKSALIAYLNSL